MEGPVAPPPASWRSDLTWIALLVLVAAAARFWQISHTEVLGRDSIGFIRLAWQLEHEPWSEVLHRAEQHPCYSLLILAVSLPVRALVAAPAPVAWQLRRKLRQRHGQPAADRADVPPGPLPVLVASRFLGVSAVSIPTHECPVARGWAQ